MSLVIVLFLTITSSIPSISTLNYFYSLGCYQYDPINPLFTVAASHVDSSILTYKTCIAGCSSIGYRLSTIQSMLCFCSNVLPQNLVSISNTNCSISTCSVNSALNDDIYNFCGTQSSIAIYAQTNLTISLSTNMSYPINLYDGLTFNFNLDYSTQFNDSIKVKATNKKFGSFYFSDNVSLSLTEPGQGNLIESYINKLQNNVMIKNFSVVDYLPIGSTINFSNNKEIYKNYFTTDVKLSNQAGTNTILNVYFNASSLMQNNNQPEQSIALYDEYYSYGVDVPLKLSNPNKIQVDSSALNVAANTFSFVSNAKLRAIEFYAAVPGTIEFYYGSSTCSIVKRQDSTCLTSEATKLTYTCTNFSKINDRCDGVSNRIIYINELFGPILNLNAKLGYNYINLNSPIQEGMVIIWKSITGYIAYEANNTNYIFDWEFFTRNTYNQIAHYIKVYITRTIPASLFYNYTSIGFYNLSVIAIGTKDGSQVSSLNNVTIDQVINGLKITTPFCILNQSCVLNSTVTSGNLIDYYWNISNTTQIHTTQKYINYTFNLRGKTTIFLNANNFISNSSINHELFVCDYLRNFFFMAISPYSNNISVSILNSIALFTFKYTTAGCYSCFIDFGNGNTRSFNDDLKDFNNSFFEQTYDSVGTYRVKLNCTGFLSSIYFEFDHFVETEIKGLKITNSLFAVRNTPFFIGYSISSGSLPNIQFYFNNVLDITANLAGLIGKSGSFNLAVSNLYPFNVTISNHVSSVNISGVFEVGAPIVSPFINVISIPINTTTSDFLFNLGTTVRFQVGMADGSNVKLDVFYGDELVSALPTNSTIFAGDWTTTQTYEWLYQNPGNYTIRANISNKFSTFLVTRTIAVVSDVNFLIPGLVQAAAKVLDKAIAYYKFSYFGSTKSGWNALVTYWPGDSFNSSFGPFQLGMDFSANTSKSQLSYDYKQLGTYQATFLVKNLFGSQTYQLSVEVKNGLQGLYIECDTDIINGGNLTVKTYLVLGTPTTQYKFSIAGQSIIMPKTSASVSVPDIVRINNIRSLNETEILTITAYDGYSSISTQYTINILDSFDNIELVTNPINTSYIVYDGSRESRTITFILSTNPIAKKLSYYIDYGDGSTVANPQAFSQPTILSYVYLYSGIFSAKITIFNSAFSQTITRDVKIYDFIKNFQCKLTWSPFDLDGTIQYDYTITNNLYYIWIDYDLKVVCNWTNTFLESLTLSIESQSISYNDMSLLKLVNEVSTFRATIPFPKNLLANVNNPNTLSLNIVYGNAYQPNKILQMNVRLVSKPVIRRVVPISKVYSPNDNVTFTVEYDSLGEPSCTIITMNNFTSGSIYATGTNSSICNSMYGLTYALTYLNDYAKTSFGGINSINFNLTMSQSGNIEMKAIIKNLVSLSSFSTNVTVSSLNCLNPQLSVDKYSSSFLNPYSFKRSELVKMVATTVINCSLTSSNIKKWTMWQISQLDGSIIQPMNLSTNPTVSNSEFVIAQNTLSYGTYKLSFRVAMNGSNINNLFVSELETFFKIIPTGINVLSMKQNKQISFGTNQTLKFSPVSDSIDYDSIANISSLKFYFYCSVIDNGISKGYPTIGLNNNIDLEKLKSFTSFNMTSNETCFLSRDQYFINNNVLTVTPQSLPFYEGRSYRFMISTNYLGQVYFQEIDAFIKNFNILPTISMQCLPQSLCKPYDGNLKINPSYQLMINGICTSGCENAFSIKFTYQIYRKLSAPTLDSAWIPFIMPTNASLGHDTYQMTLYKDLFSLDPSSILYRIDLNVESVTSSGLNTGFSSLILYKNQLPTPGSCSIDNNNGFTLTTTFTVTCSDWTDPDGDIVLYEYLANSNNSLISLGSEKNGVFSFQLPLGVYTLIINVYDDDGAKYVFNLASSISVATKNNLLNDLTKIVSNDPESSILNQLNSGNSQDTLRTISLLATTLTSFTLNTTNTTNNSSSSATNSTVDPERLLKTKLNDVLVSSLSKVSISDLNSISMWTNVLPSLSSSIDTISPSSAMTIAKMTENLIDSLTNLSSQAPVEYLKETTQGIIGSMGNALGSMTSPLNGLSSPLDKSASNSTVLTNQVIETKKKTDSVINKVTNLVNSRLNIGDTVILESSLLSLNINKQTSDKIGPDLKQGSSQINLPSFCDMTNSKPVISNSTNPSFNPPSDPNACNSKEITTLLKENKISVLGYNGGNQATVNFSATLGLSFYNSNGFSEIKIKNSSQQIKLIIPISSNVNTNFIKYDLNTTKLIQYNLTSNLTSNFTYPFFMNKIKLNPETNPALFIHIKPFNTSLSNNVGYVLWIKYGAVVNLQYYDDVRVFCPQDLITQSDETFYVYFSNSTQSKSFVNYGLRELVQSEFLNYCVNKNFSKNYFKPTISNYVAFTQEFGLRAFTSTCYFYNESSGNWLKNNLYITSNSGVKYTECLSDHLTDFAGGFIVVPPAIDFNNVWQNASFLQNPTIYITIIVISCLFVLFAVIARYLDKKDVDKVGLNMLIDNKIEDNYYYEIIVFTGNRREAATDSIVRFVLSGDLADTDIRIFNHPDRQIFRRSGIDSFIMTVSEPLGSLNFMKIWHDNSGYGDLASWFLKYIIVKDIQTKELFYFICEKWLAVEKDDGQISRIFPIATQVQKTQLKYMIRKQAQEKLFDTHLWLSIFSRPVKSSFTRLDRTVCCFVLLYISMLANILYYGIDKSANTGGLNIGPFLLTPTQIGIGIMTNLIVFPPTLLLIQLFRKSKRRTNELKKIKKKNEDFNDINGKKNSQKTLEKKDAKKSFALPWWCKIIAYILSFTFVGVSIFFIIVQGITFGDEKVQKWLTSFMSSVISSIFLTQPIKIVLTVAFFTIICRKNDDKQDMELWKDDDEEDLSNAKKNLNKYALKKENHDEFKMKLFKIGTDDGILTSEQLNIARKVRMREKKFWKLIYEILAYLIFVTLLIFVTNSYHDMNSYKYRARLNSLLLDDDFNKMTDTNDIWLWISNNFIPRLKINKWYNGDDFTLARPTISDMTTILIGFPIIRQNRIIKDSCSIANLMKSLINHCESEYGYTNEDKSNYGENWSSGLSSSQISDSFLYKSSGDLDGLPYYGKYTSYNGGGYVFKVLGETADIQANLLLLQQANWIDRQTRSVFIEFALYNPNLNLFSICTILIEILPSGNLLKSTRFDSIYLVGLNLKGNDSMVVAFYALYIVAIVFVMVKEAKQIYKLKWGYFKAFWNYVDLCLIAFSWASFFMFIYSLYSANSFKSYLKETAGKGYIKMQWINYWNELMGIFLAICICFATLRLLKLLRFNTTILQLIEAIGKSFKELSALTLIFLIQFLAFSQCFYLILNDKLSGFSTIVKTLETSFGVLLGKFNVYDIMTVSPLLTPIIFSAYNVISLLFIINLMISLLGDNYIAAKNEAYENEFYLFLKDYIHYLVRKYFKRLLNKKKVDIVKDKYELTQHDITGNTLKKLAISVFGLLNRLEKYQKEIRIIEDYYDKEKKLNDDKKAEHKGENIIKENSDNETGLKKRKDVNKVRSVKFSDQH